MTLRVRPEAREDILQAAQWYEDRQPGLGQAFVAEVEAVLARIEQGPHRFRRTRGTARVALSRRFPYATHFICEGDDIVVLAVLHQRRDPKVLDDRRDE